MEQFRNDLPGSGVRTFQPETIEFECHGDRVEVRWKGDVWHVVKVGSLRGERLFILQSNSREFRIGRRWIPVLCAVRVDADGYAWPESLPDDLRRTE